MKLDPRCRDYGNIHPRKPVRLDVAIPASLAKRIYRMAAKYRGAVGGKNQIIEECLEGFLDRYEKQILARRARGIFGEETP